MEKHAHSVSALAESANVYTSVNDVSTSLTVEVGGADEQIGESRVGTVEKKAWGFQKVVWIGCAVFVGTVIAALVFEWSSAAKSPVPNSIQLQGTRIEELSDGPIILLKSNLSGRYLHVSSGSESSGNPVSHTGSTTDGSKWQVEYVGVSDTTIMLKSVRSHDYLHVSSQSMNSGDTVVHKDSQTDGSKWLVEYAAPYGGLIMLKSVRSGNYLHALPRTAKACCDPVYHTDSAAAGSKWVME